MKTIALKNEKETITFNGQPAEVDINTVDLIETCVNHSSREGISASDMFSRIKILDAVRAVKNVKEETPTEISLEDVDYNKLAECVSAMKWTVVSRNILEFCQQFEK